MGNAYEIFALRYATMSPRTPHLNYLVPDPHETTAQDLDYFVWLIRGHGRDILVDTGFNAGVRWQPNEMLAFGANYRYSTTVDFEGHSQTIPTSPFPPYYPSTSTHASVRFPQFVAVGASFRPAPDWNFEFDVDWTDWDNVNEIVFRGTPLGDIPFVLNYRSSFMYEFGITKQLGYGYFASAKDAQDRSIATLEILSAAGADANARITDVTSRTARMGRGSTLPEQGGQSALFGAVQWAWPRVVQYLIDHGAEVAIMDDRRVSPLDAALGRAGSADNRTSPEVAKILQTAIGQ